MMLYVERCIHPAPNTLWHQVQKRFQPPWFMQVTRRKAKRSNELKTAISPRKGSGICPMSKVQGPTSFLSRPAYSVGETFGSGRWTLDIGLWTLPIRSKSTWPRDDGQ